MDIAGKLVVVTGGASGIGKALCERFASEGAAHVVVVDRNGPGAAEVAAAIGGTSRCIDVGVEQELASLVSDTETGIGPIDLFCSNAGIWVPGGLDTPDETWDRVWRVNTLAHVWAARHAAAAGRVWRRRLAACSSRIRFSNFLRVGTRIAEQHLLERQLVDFCCAGPR